MFLFQVICACIIPPVHILGGWLSLLVSMIVLGFLMFIAAEMGSIFGCLVGLPDNVSAIILGFIFHIPDIRISMWFARHRKTADMSLGYVMANVAFYVYIGLGIPWTIQSIRSSSMVSTAFQKFKTLQYL